MVIWHRTACLAEISATLAQLVQQQQNGHTPNDA